MGYRIAGYLYHEAETKQWHLPVLAIFCKFLGQVDLAETDENGNENERGNENEDGRQYILW